MRRTFSKSSKQKITAMGLAVMMTAQSPAMAAEIETSQTETTVVTQEATQEDSQEEATVAEEVSAAEQETVTEQETASEQDRSCSGTRNGVGRKCNRRNIY